MTLNTKKQILIYSCGIIAHSFFLIIFMSAIHIPLTLDIQHFEIAPRVSFISVSHKHDWLVHMGVNYEEEYCVESQYADVFMQNVQSPDFKSLKLRAKDSFSEEAGFKGVPVILNHDYLKMTEQHKFLPENARLCEKINKDNVCKIIEQPHLYSVGYFHKGTTLFTENGDIVYCSMRLSLSSKIRQHPDYSLLHAYLSEIYGLDTIDDSRKQVLSDILDPNCPFNEMINLSFYPTIGIQKTLEHLHEAGYDATQTYIENPNSQPRSAALQMSVCFERPELIDIMCSEYVINSTHGGLEGIDTNEAIHSYVSRYRMEQLLTKKNTKTEKKAHI